MERDFMGLAVKQEISDEAIDAGRAAYPQQLLSFGEDKPKTGFESLASAGLVTITRTEMQKSIEQGGGVGYCRRHPDSHGNHPVDLRAPAQLTIFYNGSVCVYDNVSADKGEAIMLLAGKPCIVESEGIKLVSCAPSSRSSSVPQFRKKSLARFLEKRKERRVMSAAPYAHKESPADYT